MTYLDYVSVSKYVNAMHFFFVSKFKTITQFSFLLSQSTIYNASKRGGADRADIYYQNASAPSSDALKSKILTRSYDPAEKCQNRLRLHRRKTGWTLQQYTRYTVRSWPARATPKPTLWNVLSTRKYYSVTNLPSGKPQDVMARVIWLPTLELGYAWILVIIKTLLRVVSYDIKNALPIALMRERALRRVAIRTHIPSARITFYTERETRKLPTCIPKRDSKSPRLIAPSTVFIRHLHASFYDLPYIKPYLI